MIENLKRWLNEMDEYRKQMRDIRKDSKVLIYIKNIYIPNKKLKKTTQFNVLKHFLIDENMKQAEKPEKSFCSFNFEENNDLIKISPPLLYKKPSDYQLKKMIKNYIEQKSLT